MPLYRWRKKGTDEFVEVLRDFKDSDVPPEEEGEWEKVIGTFTVTRGANWSGKKGDW